jgi:hypothetical protein
LGLFTGYNIKPDETDLVNIHAEDLMFPKVRDHGFEHVELTVIVAPPLVDHASGHDSPTSHPCWKCRQLYEVTGMIDDDSLVVSALPDLSIVQAYRPNDLEAFHEDGDDSGIVTFFPGISAVHWDQVAPEALAPFYPTELAA